MPLVAGSVPPRLPASEDYLATAAGDSASYSLDILIGCLIKYGNFPPVHGGGGHLNMLVASPQQSQTPGPSSGLHSVHVGSIRAGNEGFF